MDALLPPEMAEKAETLGVKKSEMAAWPMFILAVLAGAFIALGAIFSLVVGVGSAELPFGVGRLLVGAAFSLGLILVVVGGAELFTGNNLVVMAWASGKVGLRALLRGWTIVYAGNLVGSVGTAALFFLAGSHAMAGGALGEGALRIAEAKLALDPLEAVARGVLCNVLVCLAVWLSFSARSTVDRVVAVVPPITAFVAAGFEHCVANMFFVPYALFLQASGAVEASESLGWLPFLTENLAPVTLGNVLGGGGLVGLVYWSIFLRRRDRG